MELLTGFLHSNYLHSVNQFERCKLSVQMTLTVDFPFFFYHYYYYIVFVLSFFDDIFVCTKYRLRRFFLWTQCSKHSAKPEFGWTILFSVYDFHVEETMATVNDLPDEILEFIFSHMPPYKDLQSCALVCKRWTQIVQSTNKFIDKISSIVFK